MTEEQLKDHLMKSQQELPTKADAIEKKILDSNNISFDEYFEYVNSNTDVQEKMMKLNNFITMATQMIDPEFDQADLLE